MKDNREEITRKHIEKIASWFMLLILVLQVVTTNFFGIVAQAESYGGNLHFTDEQGAEINSLEMKEGETKIIGLRTTNGEDKTVQVGLNGFSLEQEQTSQANGNNPVTVAYSPEAANVLIGWQDTQETTTLETEASVEPLMEPQAVDRQVWLVIKAEQAGNYQLDVTSIRESGSVNSNPLTVNVLASELPVTESTQQTTAVTEGTEASEETQQTTEATESSSSEVKEKAQTRASNITYEVLDKNTNTWGPTAEIKKSADYSNGVDYRITWTAGDAAMMITDFSAIKWGTLDINKVEISPSEAKGNPLVNYGDESSIIFDDLEVGTTYTVTFHLDFIKTSTAFNDSYTVEGNIFTMPIVMEEAKNLLGLDGTSTIFEGDTKVDAVFPQSRPLQFTDADTNEVIKDINIQFKITYSDGKEVIYNTETDGVDGVVYFPVGKSLDDYKLEILSAPGYDSTKNFTTTFLGAGNYITSSTVNVNDVQLTKEKTSIKNTIEFDKPWGYFYDSVVSTQTIKYESGPELVALQIYAEKTAHFLSLNGDVEIYRINADGAKILLGQVSGSDFWKQNGDGYSVDYKFDLDSPLGAGDQVIIVTPWILSEESPDDSLTEKIYTIDIRAEGTNIFNGGTNKNSVQTDVTAYPKKAIDSTITKEIYKDGVSVDGQELKVGDEVTYKIKVKAKGDLTAQLRVTQLIDNLPYGLTFDANSKSAVRLITSQASKNLVNGINYSYSGNEILFNFISGGRPNASFAPSSMLYISDDKATSELTVEIDAKVATSASGKLVNNASVTTQTRTEDNVPTSWGNDKTQSAKVENFVKPKVLLEKHIYQNDPTVNSNQATVTDLFVNDPFYYSIDVSLAKDSGALYNGIVKDEVPVGLKVTPNSTFIIVNNARLNVPAEAIAWSGQNVTVDFSKVPELQVIKNTQAESEGTPTTKASIVFQVIADPKLANKPGVTNNASVSGTDKDGANETSANSSVTAQFYYPAGKPAIEKAVGTFDSNGNFVEMPDKSPVKVGDIISYQLVVSNVGKIGTSIENVVASDKLPLGLSYQNGSAKLDNKTVEAKVTENADGTQTIDVSVGQLLGETSVIVTIDVKVTKEATGTLKNIASLTGTVNETPGSPATTIETPEKERPTTELGIKPNPSLTKAINQTVAFKGEELTYTIVAKNETGAPIINGHLTDMLPNEVAYVADSMVITINGQKVENPTINWSGTAGGNNSFDYSGFTLTSEDTIVITYRVTATTDEAKTGIENVAKLTGSYKPDALKDDVLPTEEKTAEAEFQTVWQAGNLAIKKEVAKDKTDWAKKVVKVGETIQYKLIVSNTVSEPSIIKNVSVTDTLPQGLSYVDGSVKVTGVTGATATVTNGVVTVVIPEMTAEQAKTPVEITFDVVVETEALATIENTAYAEGEIPANPKDPENSDWTDLTKVPSNEVVVYKQPEPTIKKEIVTPKDGKVFAGDTVTYQLTVMNNKAGEKDPTIGDLLDAHVVDTLPAGLTYVKGSTKIDGGTLFDEKLAWKDDTHLDYTFTNDVISSGETRVITFEVTVDKKATGEIINTAVVDGKDLDKTPVSGNDSSVPITVYPKPGKLEIQKKVFDGAKEIPNGVVTVGQELTYQLVVKNSVAALSEVREIVVEDEIPAGLTYVPSSLKVDVPSNVTVGEQEVTGNKLKVTLNSLSGDQEITITFKVKVEKAGANDPGTISNTGNVVGQIPSQPGGDFDKPTTDSDTVDVQRAPEPTIVKSILENTTDDTAYGVMTDQVFTYQLVVKNGEAANVGDLVNGVVTDTLPDGLEYVAGSTVIDGQAKTDDASVGWSITPDKATLNYQLATPYKGQQQTIIQFKVTVKTGTNPNEVGKIITNTATVSGNNADPNDKTVYTDQDSADVKLERGAGDLVIKKSVLKDDVDFDQKVVQKDSIISYELVISNSVVTASKVESVKVTDVLPTGLIYQGNLKIDNPKATGSVEDNVVTITIPELNESEVVTVRFDVQVTADAKGKITNVAEATGTVTYPDGTSTTKEPEDTVTNHKAPEPKIEKNVLDSNGNIVENLAAIKGQQIAYQLVITNGVDDKTGVLVDTVISDQLPAGLNYVSGTTKVDGAPIEDAIVGWQNNELNYKLTADMTGGTKVVLTFMVTMDSEQLGTITNHATVTGKDADKSPDLDYTDEDLATINVVRGPGKLALVKEVQKTAADGSTDMNGKITAINSVIQYNLIVTNTEKLPSIVNNITISDLIPEGLEYVKGTLYVDNDLKPDSAIVGQQLVVEIGSLTEGQTKTISFQVEVTQSVKGISENTGIVNGNVPTTSGKEEPLDDVESNTVVTYKGPNPTIAKSVVGNSAVTTQGIVTYRLVVKNDTLKEAPQSLYNGSVTDKLPAGLIYQTGSMKVDGVAVSAEVEADSWQENVLTYKLASPFTPEQETIIEFDVKVETDKLGEITNTATVLGEDQDGNSGYTDTDSTPITLVRAPGKLQLEKSVLTQDSGKDLNNQVVKTGSMIRYTIVVKNSETAPSVVNDVTVIDDIPTGLILQADSIEVDGKAVASEAVTILGQKMTVKIGDLLENSSKTISFLVEVTKEAKGVSQNIAQAQGTVPSMSGEEPTQLVVEDQKQTRQGPDPTIEKSVITENPSNVAKGATVRYRLVVKNGTEDTGDLIDGVITDQLPKGLVYVAGSTTINNQPVVDAGIWTNNVLTYRLTTPYAGGSSTTVEFLVTVTEVGTIVNNASVSGVDVNQDPYAESSSAAITAVVNENLAVDPTTPKGPTDPGSSQTGNKTATGRYPQTGETPQAYSVLGTAIITGLLVYLVKRRKTAKHE